MVSTVTAPGAGRAGRVVGRRARLAQVTAALERRLPPPSGGRRAP